MIDNVKHHKQLPVYGDGMQIATGCMWRIAARPLIWWQTAARSARCTTWAATTSAPQHLHRQTIINQLHDRLQDEGINEELIEHVADRLGHDRRYGIDPTKIKNDLGWYPETPFEKGIVLTIDWYLNHQEWMDHVTSGDYQNYYQDMYKNK